MPVMMSRIAQRRHSSGPRLLEQGFASTLQKTPPGQVAKLINGYSSIDNLSQLMSQPTYAAIVRVYCRVCFVSEPSADFLNVNAILKILLIAPEHSARVCLRALTRAAFGSKPGALSCSPAAFPFALSALTRQQQHLPPRKAVYSIEPVHATHQAAG